MTVRALSAPLIAAVCLALAPPLAASDASRPRIATLPFAAPGGLEVLGRELQRSLAASLAHQVDLAPVEASVAGEPADSCLVHPACVDRVLAATHAEALLVGQIERDPDNPAREPRVLLSLVGPDWPVSYLERRATPEGSSVERVARELLVEGRGVPLPEPAEVKPAEEKAGPIAPLALEDSVDAADAGLDEGAVAAAQAGKGKRDRRAEKKAEREQAQAEQARTEQARAEQARAEKARQEGGKEAGPDADDTAAQEARRQEEPRPIKPPKPAPPPAPPRPPLQWPARAPAGPWHGLTLELQGGAAYGALSVVGDSEIATTDGELSDIYRWAVRQDQSGWSGTAGVGFILGNHVEAGIEAGILTAPQRLSLFYQKYATTQDPSTGLLEKQPDGPPQTLEVTQQGLHTLIIPRVRYFPLTGSRVEPYIGLGLGVWLIPGFHIDPAKAGPQPDLGPWQRVAIQPSLGMRVLVQKRLFVGIEADGLIDPGEPFLTRDFDKYTGDIPGQYVISAPEPSRVVGSVRLGLGLLL